MFGVVRMGKARARSSPTARSRSSRAPSSRPMTSSPADVSSTSPGACQVAPKPTTHPIVRSSPTSPAIASSFSPFCSETTSLAGPSRPVSGARAARVACERTARSSTSQDGGRCAAASGVSAESGMTSSPSTLRRRRPGSRRRRTCSGFASMTRSATPARVRRAATVPPIAPAPTHQTRMARSSFSGVCRPRQRCRASPPRRLRASTSRRRGRTR